MSKRIGVIQLQSPCLMPGLEAFNPEAKPGMLMVDGELHEGISFKVESVDVRWVTVPDFRDLPKETRALYVVYQGDGLTLMQRPLSAEATGELKAGKTYHISGERFTHRGHSFYAVKAVEVPQAPPEDPDACPADWHPSHSLLHGGFLTDCRNCHISGPALREPCGSNGADQHEDTCCSWYDSGRCDCSRGKA